ncbi:hypothetical protein [Piscirickettsia salmonis]|nr:hypothetical protein [Piscirickettsia salmonis]QNR82523.1 hypothetical protein ICC15_18855 [Piscirickettsia salmonis]QNR82529.1 hypothetical protein ICC15_18910 [Piscirickettsia salmonis]
MNMNSLLSVALQMTEGVIKKSVKNLSRKRLPDQRPRLQVLNSTAC